MDSQYEAFFRVARLEPNFFYMAVINLENWDTLGNEIFAFPQQFLLRLKASDVSVGYASV
jgi:hypothetical protein